ncbi:MAG: chemotaxis protein CheA [Firmicutes bacterium]|jgi:two-component system chemotaxis sensor kinase CheA|nr:chemotaxis protein CheA [Bacillota bacterium]
MDQSFGITSEDIAVFLQEALEQLQLLEDDLLVLEQDRANPEVLSEIFRAAHTLKGSSATLGHERMARLAHSMESVLDGLRKNEITVTRHTIDVLFQCLDALRALTKEIATGEQDGTDVSGLTARLEEIQDNQTTGMGGDSTILVVRFSAGCVMPAVRAYQVVDRLMGQFDVLATVPGMDRIEAGDELQELRVILSLGAHGENPERAREVALSVGDVIGAEFIRDAGRPGTPCAIGAAGTSGACVAPEAPGSPPGATRAPVSASSGGNQKRDAASVSSATVRVDVSRLDTLSNLVAELVIDRTRLAQIESRIAAKHGEDELLSDLNRTSMHIGRLTTELQEAINKARMLPIEKVFRRFPRMVRDLAQKHGKDVDFVIEGEDTELDRSVSEEIGDPIIHLLRNAVGHGIESQEERVASGKPPRGALRLSAFREENCIVIQVQDDGRGIDIERVKASAIRRGLISEEAAMRLPDREAVNLIFSPGLSTAEKVDDTSGRGVGMDIVRKNIEKLNGSVSIETAPGQGTTFTVKLPLTLAIIHALLVSVESRIYAIPLASVVEITRVEAENIRTVRGREAILARGAVVPLIRLHEVFGFPGADGRSGARAFAVVVSSPEGWVALVVDSLLGEMEVVIKSLGAFVGNIPGVSGVTILGDGRIALILDIPSLARKIVDERHAG